MAAEMHTHEHGHGAPHDHGDAPGRASYAPVEIAALGMGAFFIVIGAVALARMGWATDALRTSSTEVLGIGMTPFLAWIHLGAGVLALLCAGGKELARGGMMLLGSLALASGIVAIWRPDFLSDWLAMTRTNGVAYLVAGGVALATAIGTPLTMVRRRGVPAM